MPKQIQTNIRTTRILFIILTAKLNKNIKLSTTVQ
jgi:hypothetical protein